MTLEPAFAGYREAGRGVKTSTQEHNSLGHSVIMDSGGPGRDERPNIARRSQKRGRKKRCQENYRITKTGMG